MMMNTPPNLAEADTARSPQQRARSAEPGTDSGPAGSFARLLAGSGGQTTGAAASPDPALTITPPGALPEELLAEALAEALVAAIETGKIVPPDGEVLPPGFLVRGPAGTTAQPATGDDAPLARMVDMLRALQGFAGQLQPAAEGERPLQPMGEFRVIEQTEPARLLSTALASQATPPAGLATTSATAATPAAAATPPSVPIAVAPGRPDWSEAVGQRVLWMVSHKTQAAEIRLNPPELGPVEVKVRTDDDGVRLSFAAGNAAVREALESAAPRLREMFLAEGLRLENLDIGQRHAGGERGGEPGDAGLHDGGVDEDADQPVRTALPERVGIVDVFV